MRDLQNLIIEFILLRHLGRVHKFFLAFTAVACTFSANSNILAELNLQCRLTLSKKPELVQKYFDSVRYKSFEGLKIPYLDVNPSGKKTIVLIAGFSHSMLVWSEQIELLASQGFRVVSVELSNIGLNLKQNGLIDLKSNQGVEFDAGLVMQIINSLGVKNLLTVAGHSRGGGVASQVVKQLIQKKNKVASLVLLSPYVRYIWSHGAYSDSVLLWWLEQYPGLVGRQISSSSEYGKIEDEVIDLPSSLRQTGYAYVLKGLQPSSKVGGEKIEFETADPISEILKNSKVKVTIVGAENDKELAPANVLNELEFSGVKLLFLEGQDYDHYWPLEHYKKANQFIKGDLIYVL